MVLKSNIHTLALPGRQQSDWGLRVTQNAYFSLITHSKQLLSVTFFDTNAGIGVIFQTHIQTHGQRRTDGGQTEGQTDVEVEIVI